MPGSHVPRIGTARAGVIEVALGKLIALHRVPRPGKPATYISDLANNIRLNGYRLNEAIPVIKMPDGRLIMAGGHHRAAAMASLGEQTIPARIVGWDSLSPAVQNWYRGLFPGVF